MEGTQNVMSVLDGLFNQPTVPAPAVPAPAVPAPAVPAPAVPPAPQAQTDPVPAPAAPPAQTPEEIFKSKGQQNDAFAKLRIANTQYDKTVNQIAQILGIQHNGNLDVLVQGLQQKINEYDAQSRNLPLDIVERLQKAEEMAGQFQQSQLQTQAALGFQKVKDTYKLSDTDLADFATKLAQQGLNPYTTPMDLLQQYQTLYFVDIMKKAQDAAVQEALARAGKADAHSTTPIAASGTIDAPVAGKGGMAALSRLLDTLPKK